MSYTMWGEAETPWMRDMARDILTLLDTVYPGHPWKVMVYGDKTGGGYFIQHMEFEGKPYGINQPKAHLFASASEFKNDVISRGGELLERVSLTRGARKEVEKLTHMDGVPDLHQPAEYQQGKNIEKAIAFADNAMREGIRPQALREANKND